MSNGTDTLLIVVLVCAVGYLVYLDWLRKGELDFLAEEVTRVKRVYEEGKGGTGVSAA